MIKIELKTLSDYLLLKGVDLSTTYYPACYFDRELSKFLPKDAGMFQCWLTANKKEVPITLETMDGKTVDLVEDWKRVFDDLIKKEFGDESKAKKGA